MSKIEYLEEERKKIWAKIVQIEADLNKKTSDFEKEARQSSKKASEFRNRTEGSKKTAEEHLNLIKSAYEEINKYVESSKVGVEDISNVHGECSSKLELIKNKFDEVSTHEATLIEKIQLLEETFKNHPSLKDEIEELESHFSAGENLQNKINTIYKSSLSKKKELDELSYDILGYTEENDKGENTHVEGLKDELEKSFEKIKSNINVFGEELQKFKDSKKNDVVNFIGKWEQKIEGINKKITELLPNALTAGLSHAYSDKKKAEETEGTKHNKSFHIAIWCLVAVSLIPFGVNLVLWLQGKSLEALILDMPRLVLAILPLYIPFLWLAYNANKKSNLSKRLVEEYTHKEVLSKTFEGLSRQIEEIDDEDTSSELRTKLIYNILNVSSENPGKLITDYNKADHPLIDALDKSIQLATAVDKLSGIPGFSKISKMIDKKSKKILEEKTLKAEQGLSSLEIDNESEKKEAINK